MTFNNRATNECRVEAPANDNLAKGVSIIPLDLRDSLIITVWIDDKLTGENVKFHEWLQRNTPHLKIVTVTSTKELLVWLNNFGSDVVHKLRIIRLVILLHYELIFLQQPIQGIGWQGQSCRNNDN